MQHRHISTHRHTHTLCLYTGDIGTVKDAAELADMGYDAVVLGRGLAASPDIERLITTIRKRESLPSLLTGAGMMAEEMKRGGQDGGGL